MPEDPSQTVERILESGRNIRFGKGVVAKTSHVAVLTIAVWGIIAWRWSDNLSQNMAMIFVGILVTLFSVWFIRSTQSFAEKNPAQAMLEGAELLEWRRMDEKVKNQLSAPNQISVDTTAVPHLKQEDGI